MNAATQERGQFYQLTRPPICLVHLGVACMHCTERTVYSIQYTVYSPEYKIYRYMHSLFVFVGPVRVRLSCPDRLQGPIHPNIEGCNHPAAMLWQPPPTSHKKSTCRQAPGGRPAVCTQCNAARRQQSLMLAMTHDGQRSSRWFRRPGGDCSTEQSVQGGSPAQMVWFVRFRCRPALLFEQAPPVSRAFRIWTPHLRLPPVC